MPTKDMRLRRRMEHLGLSPQEIVALFPIVGRIVLDDAPSDAVRPAIIHHMQLAQGRIDALKSSRQGGQRVRASQLGLGRTQEALWLACARELGRQPTELTGQRIVDTSGKLDPDVLDNFPLIGRLVFGPPATELEGVLCLREMNTSKQRFDDLEQAFDGAERAFAAAREYEAMRWTCAAHLVRKS